MPVVGVCLNLTLPKLLVIGEQLSHLALHHHQLLAGRIHASLSLHRGRPAGEGTPNLRVVAGRTTTITTNPSTAGPSRSRPVPPPPTRRRIWRMRMRIGKRQGQGPARRRRPGTTATTATTTTTRRNPANGAGPRRSLARCSAKVRCSYSGRPSTVKREGGSNPTGERLAVLESQVAQLLADNRQLRDGQVKANTYYRHINRKLDWLLTDAVRRRRTPPELPEAGPSGLLKKQRRVMDSDKEEDCEREKEVEEQGMEEDGEGDEEPAPVKGKERAE
ncbi:hypothetical protein LENED_011140 [Lentinula edodes]|uniref:Uncharacterized protein n=1 Tax=Lentinula edodes TaxID=5353 RepID=A0A1Q3EP78_LENED|nr:hypothetical protein LENED_011140 [Lentinula edodes]